MPPRWKAPRADMHKSGYKKKARGRLKDGIEVVIHLPVFVPDQARLCVSLQRMQWAAPRVRQSIRFAFRSETLRPQLAAEAPPVDGAERQLVARAGDAFFCAKLALGGDILACSPVPQLKVAVHAHDDPCGDKTRMKLRYFGCFVLFFRSPGRASRDRKTDLFLLGR